MSVAVSKCRGEPYIIPSDSNGDESIRVGRQILQLGYLGQLSFESVGLSR